jgi:thioredoxin reductase
MAIDTPAKLAILGAGPIGLEAALYARFLGYDVVVFDAGEVAANVRRWGHVRMFTPFGINRSPLGLAAIQAQDETWQPPPDDALLTGDEWADRYLLPLSQTDLLSDHLRLNTTVVAVGKEEMHKGDMPGHEDRGDWSFRILVREQRGPHAPREEAHHAERDAYQRSAGTERVEQGGPHAPREEAHHAERDAYQERVELADGVLDCTGVFGQANWAGQGGTPAIGEMSLRERIEYRLPDILGSDRGRYADKHTLLVGCGASAATNAVALAQLAKDAPKTRVTWITRREGPAGASGPVTVIASDRLPQRAALAVEANRLAGNPSSGITYWPRTVIERIRSENVDGPFQVELSGEHPGTIAFDQVIANVGFRPDRRLYEELQIHECYATEGPMKLAAAMSKQAAADCLDQKAHGPQTLLNPEPNFYVLGHKSYGRNPNFLLSVGLDQIREVFTILGDREALDLYSGVKPLFR